MGELHSVQRKAVVVLCRTLWMIFLHLINQHSSFALPCSKSVYTHILWCVSFQLAFTCSKLTIETLEQGVKYVQSLQ